MTPKAVLFTLLAALGALFTVGWIRSPAVSRQPGKPLVAAPDAPLPLGGRGALARRIAIGLVTDFFDTLGVGSFATTTSLFKLGRIVADEDIPGTLNIGHTLPTLLEAFIYIAVVDVDITTLAAMIAASVAGAYLGSGVVARWPRRKLQISMAMLLLVAASIIALRQGALVPGGGTALGVTGTRLALGVGCNFILGALMTLGIGLYAPCMILVSLLGMDPRASFPIMMGSCAFLMPVASLRFIRSGRYDGPAALGLAAGGIPGVLIAAFLVKSLSLGAVQWLVVAVVVYTAAAMLKSARGVKNSAGRAAAAGRPEGGP